MKQLISGSLSGKRIRPSLPQLCIAWTGTCIAWEVQRLGAGVWGGWGDPRARAAVDSRETYRGEVREETVMGNGCGGKPRSHGSKAILLSHAEWLELLRGKQAARPGVSKQEMGFKCQAFFISPLSGRGKQTVYGNVFFLSYANEIMCLLRYLLWNLPFFKLVPPKTNFFFLFSNLGLIIVQQTSILINCFMAGDDTPRAIPPQKCILWERGLVKLPQP